MSFLLVLLRSPILLVLIYGEGVTSPHDINGIRTVGKAFRRDALGGGFLINKNGERGWIKMSYEYIGCEIMPTYILSTSTGKSCTVNMTT